MSFTRRTPAVVLVGAGLLGLAAGPTQAAGSDLEALMVPSAAFPRVHGDAELDRQASYREFEVSLHQGRRLAGRIVWVRVHGVLVGTMRFHVDGFAHLDRHSGVPAMSAGDVVRVRTKAGTLVSRGVLRVDPD